MRSLLKDFLIIILLFATVPFSVYMAWVASESVLIAALFLPIPTAGLFYWAIVNIFGDFFLSVAISWTLGFGGAALGMLLFAIINQLDKND